MAYKHFTQPLLVIVALLGQFLPAQAQEDEHGVAYEWIEVQLQGIRVDFARPPIHARNLYHVSLAMYDAWAAYDDLAEPISMGSAKSS